MNFWKKSATSNFILKNLFFPLISLGYYENMSKMRIGFGAKSERPWSNQNIIQVKDVSLYQMISLLNGGKKNAF